MKGLDIQPGSNEHMFVLPQVFKLICRHRSLNCTSALLRGETGLMFDLLWPVECCWHLRHTPKYGLTPLATAADTLCFALTDVFLKHGADPSLGGLNIRTLIPLLPLSVALDAFCQLKPVRDFPAGGSVYKLFSLFWLPELKEPLDLIKLLASKTNQLTDVAVHCVEEFNLVKLAALLLVARNKLVGDNLARNWPISHLIWLQHALESDERKREIMRSMWDALRLLQRSGNFVEQYRTTSMLKHEAVPLEVAYRFLSDVKLPEEQRLVFSADLDSVRLETYLVEEMSPKSITTEQKQESSTDLDRFAAELRLGDKVLLESALLEKMCSNSIISESIYITSEIPDETDVEKIDDFSFFEKLEYIMRLDDRDEFVKLMNELGSFGCSDCRNEQLRNVRKLMFSFDSANCAAAVLAGETKSFFNFSDLTEVIWSFLHKAARFANPKLAALFLENGFLADLRRDCDELNLQAALPLNVAVERIRTNYIFRGSYKNKSAIDLVVLLCTSYFRKPLETIRLLVQKTSNVQFEFLRYLKEGKMVELCALLLVGCKELLPSAFLVRSLVSTSITRNAGVRCVSTSSGHVNLHEDTDLLEWKGTLLLIDIFEKIGDYLGAYVRLEQSKREDQIRSEISWLLLRAGISETQICKFGDCFLSGFYAADHERLLGRSYQSIMKQHSQLKLLPVNMFPKQAASNLLLKQRDCSLHSSALKVATDLAPIPAKGLINVLQRRYSPIRCISVVAVLRKGIRRI